MIGGVRGTDVYERRPGIRLRPLRHPTLSPLLASSLLARHGVLRTVKNMGWHWNASVGWWGHLWSMSQPTSTPKTKRIGVYRRYLV